MRITALTHPSRLPASVPRHALIGSRPAEHLQRIERQMGNRLYVGNLSWDTNEETLRAAFAADGRNVKEASIVTDRDTGKPRGFAFVEMSSGQDAQSAINALDGTELDGRNIKVNEAKEREPRGGGSGGGGYGGGGDRW
jgi:RNA recognition motif-containing protein